MTTAESEQEKKNKRIAMLTTVGVNTLVVLLLFLIIAWRAPNPPLPEYGIELNFGTSDVGSGDIPPETETGSEGTQAEEPAQQEPDESQPQEQTEATEDTKPAETKPVESQPISKLESPEVVKKEETKPAEKPKEEPAKKPAETKKETEVKPKDNPQAVYKPTQKTDTDNKSTDSKAGKTGSEGDNTDKTGNKGKVEGTLATGGQYTGQPGGGGGGVSMSGFNGFEWPKVTTPSLPDEAYGVYEFIVKVDDQGDVISVTPVTRGLSVEAERKLKDVIQRLTFIPKGSNLPPSSEGRITFKVVSK